MCWRPNFLELQRISLDQGAFTSKGDREHIHMYPLCICAHQLDSPPSWSLCLPKTKYNQTPFKTASQSLHQVLAADWFVLKTMQRKRGILPRKITLKSKHLLFASHCLVFNQRAIILIFFWMKLVKKKSELGFLFPFPFLRSPLFRFLLFGWENSGWGFLQGCKIGVPWEREQWQKHFAERSQEPYVTGHDTSRDQRPYFLLIIVCGTRSGKQEMP